MNVTSSEPTLYAHNSPWSELLAFMYFHNWRVSARDDLRIAIVTWIEGTTDADAKPASAALPPIEQETIMTAQATLAAREPLSHIRAADPTAADNQQLRLRETISPIRE